MRYVGGGDVVSSAGILVLESLDIEMVQSMEWNGYRNANIMHSRLVLRCVEWLGNKKRRDMTYGGVHHKS